MECVEICQTWACTTHALGSMLLIGTGVIVVMVVLLVSAYVFNPE